MEPANLGVILDSSIMIEAERQHLDVARFLKLVRERIGEREAALCAITVAELAHGIHRANTPERSQARRAFLDDLKGHSSDLSDYGRHCGTHRKDPRRIVTARHRHPFR